MKKTSQLAAKPATPAAPEMLHHVRPHGNAVAGAAVGSPKSTKRDNVFSKSRDTREDRGLRQMKTAQNSQTFPHSR
jgi:hypothetical protein